MIPLFKTQASIGKSILRIDDVKRIADENNLEEVYLVEDTMVGFPDAFRTLGDRLSFGYRFSIYNDDESDESESKIIAFADGDQGYQDLCSLYTRSCQEKQKTPWDFYKNLKFAIPFYDSFIYKNRLSFSAVTHDFSKIKPVLFEEDNDHPLDNILKKGVKAFAKEEGLTIVKTKSIYYNLKEDFRHYLAFRCINNRSKLSKPNLEFMCSEEFSFESWAEKNNIKPLTWKLLGLDENRWRIKLFSSKTAFKSIGEGIVNKKNNKINKDR